MKRFYSFLLPISIMVANVFSQGIKDTIPATKRITAATPGGAITGIRLPNGGIDEKFLTGAFIVTPAELSNSAVHNLTSGRTITQIGYATVDSNFATGPHSAAQKADSLVTGTITIYMQNTTNTVFSKTGSWATALSSMTPVYTGPFIIYPDSVYEVMFTTNNNFVYTGGGLYIAYQYQKDVGSKSVSSFLDPSGVLIPKGPMYDANNLVPNSCFVSRSNTGFPSVISASGSSFRPAFRIVHNQILGLDETKSDNTAFSVSPNPTLGVFKLNGNVEAIRSVKVLDITGKVILSQSKQDLDQGFDISKYSAGIYYLHIHEAGRVTMIKFVKD